MTETTWPRVMESEPHIIKISGFLKFDAQESKVQWSMDVNGVSDLWYLMIMVSWKGP